MLRYVNNNTSHCAGSSETVFLLNANIQVNMNNCDCDLSLSYIHLDCHLCIVYKHANSRNWVHLV